MSQSHFITKLIRGGQVTFHQLRMFKQIISRLLGYSLAGMLIIDGCWVYLHIDPYQWSVLFDYYWAQWMVSLDPKSTQLFEFPNHTTGKVLNHQLLSSHYMITHVDALFHTLIQTLIISGGLYLTLALLLCVWLARKGDAQTQETPKKEKLVSNKQFIKRLKKERQASDIRLGKLPILKDSESSHFFLQGSTGTGKSQLFYQLLDQIRQRGDRVIVYDRGCQYMKYFYRPEQDLLLNPLDQRSQAWNVWSECRQLTDYERLAAALVSHPKHQSDPFWVDAARTLLACCMSELGKRDQRDTRQLIYYCLTAPLTELYDFLKTTPAASLVTPESDKMAASIRSVLANSLKSMVYLTHPSDQAHHKCHANPTPTFSIREWLKDESQHNTLFIASTIEHHTALTPLLTAWLDMAVNGILSLPENPKRRVWLLLDELPTLHRLPCLQGALAEGRKYGACLVLGLQTIYQLHSTYGMQEAEAMRSMTNTAVFLRTSNAKTAQWVSDELGKIDVERVSQGISYGANTMRDGVSINRQIQNKPIILADTIATLPNLSGYLCLSNQYPITPITLTYQARHQVTPGFAERADLDTLSYLGKDVRAPITRRSRASSSQEKTRDDNGNRGNNKAGSHHDNSPDKRYRSTPLRKTRKTKPTKQLKKPKKPQQPTVDDLTQFIDL